MPIVLGAALVFALSFAPMLWIRYVLRRHGAHRGDLAGTGAELATHLLRRFELDDVTVERGGKGVNHYDPSGPVIRLSPELHDGRSLAAVAVAAHEVGHAIQFGRGEPISRLRTRWLPIAQRLKRAGVLVLTLLPLAALLTRSPAAILVVLGIGLSLQLGGVLAHAVVLPEEFDASFNKALPVLEAGGYVETDDLRAVRQVLKAAALTYVAAALADLVNIGRWAMILLRR